MASGPITSWQIEGETMETVTDFIFFGSKITVDSNCSYEIKRRLLLERKAMTNLNLRQHIKKQRNYFVDKGPSSQSYDFSSVQMWELDNKKGWTLKNWYFWTVVLEKTLESPLDSKIKPINLKGSQRRIFIGRTDTTLTTWCKQQTHRKRLWCWERLKAGGEGDDRGWDGWMSSSTQGAWILANSGR